MVIKFVLFIAIALFSSWSLSQIAPVKGKVVPKPPLKSKNISKTSMKNQTQMATKPKVVEAKPSPAPSVQAVVPPMNPVTTADPSGMVVTVRPVKNSDSTSGGRDLASQKPTQKQKQKQKQFKPVNAKTVDLSSAIADSNAKVKAARKEIRPPETKELKKKRPSKMIISGPAETVEVPDTVEWEHNRHRQDEQIKKLNEGVQKEIPQKVED